MRLAPETLQALRTAQPVVSGGWNLGTLAGEGGRFVQSVRWLPATNASDDDPGGHGTGRGARRDQRPGLRPPTLSTTRDALRPLEDVRYVVDSGLKDSGRRVQIVTRADVVSVTFKKAEARTSRETAVDRTLSLLRTAMNLPDPRVPRSG